MPATVNTRISAFVASDGKRIMIPCPLAFGAGSVNDRSASVASVSQKGFRLLPAKQGSSPGQARAVAAQDDSVAGLNTSFGVGFVQGNRDRSCRGVAVTIEIGVDKTAVNPENVDGGIDDANVGLVGNVQIHVAGLELAHAQHVLNGIAQDGGSPIENGPPIHLHVVQALSNQFGSGRQ